MAFQAHFEILLLVRLRSQKGVTVSPVIMSHERKRDLELRSHFFFFLGTVSNIKYEFSFKSYKTCVYDKALKSFISLPCKAFMAMFEFLCPVKPPLPTRFSD